MIIENCRQPKYINGEWRACGKCPYCKAKAGLEWTVRGVHESMTQSKKIFITITYDEKNISRTAKKKETPNDCRGTLKKNDLKNFFKSLRRWCDYHLNGQKIKYIACGEYGGTDKKDKYGNPCGTWRPHYHAIIYGLSKQDIDEKTLKKIWKNKGNIKIDKKPFVGTKAIAYTVGYVNKKMKDDNGWSHYEGNGRTAPFQWQSQQLGKNWSDKNPNWYLNLKTGYDGKKTSIPRYYIKKVYEEEGKKVRIINKITKVREQYADVDDYAAGQYFVTKNENDEDQYMTLKGKTHESVIYKIFKNPNGTKTAKILSQLHENALLRLEKAKIRYNMSDEEYNALIAQEKAKIEAQKAKIEQEWQDAQTMTDEELQNKYSHHTYTITSRISPNYENAQISKYAKNMFNQAIKSAKEKNKEIQDRTEKWKRVKIERSEEAQEFIENFKSF